MSNTTDTLARALEPYTCECGERVDPTAHSYSFEGMDEHLHCAELAALEALERDRRRAHSLAQPAARARARYKRLARGGGDMAALVEAMDEAVRLSCERRDLLERIATDSAALAQKAIPGRDRHALAQQAAEDRASLEACHDVERLRL